MVMPSSCEAVQTATSRFFPSNSLLAMLFHSPEARDRRFDTLTARGRKSALRSGGRACAVRLRLLLLVLVPALLDLSHSELNIGLGVLSAPSTDLAFGITSLSN